MTRCACSQTKVVGRAKELEDKKDRRDGLMEEQEQLETEMKRFVGLPLFTVCSVRDEQGKESRRQRSRQRKGAGPAAECAVHCAGTRR